MYLGTYKRYALNTKKFLLLIFIPCTLLTYSQEIKSIDSTSTSTSIGFRYNTGALIPHDKPLVPLKKDAINAIEIYYSFHRIDNKQWHTYFNNPEVGVAYMLMDLGYKDVLGYSHSLYPFITFPLSKPNKPLSLNFRMAMGLSYISKIYDSISNPLNMAISTPISLYFSFGLNLKYRLNQKMSVTLGLFGSHYSNGSIKKPNYGLNILNSNFGLSYNFSKAVKKAKFYQKLDDDKTRWMGILSGGIKETKDPGGSKYGIGSLSIEYSKPIKTLLRYGATIEYMYDGSTLLHFKLDSIPYQSKLKASKLGFAIMGELSLYRLSAFANFGIYLYNIDKQNKVVYQKIGIRYRLTNAISAQIVLKTHSTVADYFDLGIGYRFR